MLFSLEKELLEKVLNYMASKPFSEVNQLILEIQKTAKEIKEEIVEEEN